MSSPYAEYAEERSGQKTIEYDWGFLTYRIIGKQCEVYDIFVRKEFRRTRKAWDLLDEVVTLARTSGCDTLVGFNWPATPGATESMQAAIAYGFKLHSVEGLRILLVKDIGG